MQKTIMKVMTLLLFGLAMSQITTLNAQTPGDPHISKLKYSSDGSYLAVIERGVERLTIYKTETMQVIFTLDSLPENHLLIDVDWSSDNERFALGISVTNATGQPIIQVWNVITGENLLSYQDSANSYAGALAIAWKPNSEEIVFADGDVNRILDVSTGTEVNTLSTQGVGTINQFDWSSDGNFLAGANLGYTYVWDEDLNLIYTKAGDNNIGIVWHNTFNILATNYRYHVELWDVEANTIIMLPKPQDISTLEMLDWQGIYLFARGASFPPVKTVLLLWDTSTQELLLAREVEDKIKAVAVHPNASTFIYGSFYNTNPVFLNLLNASLHGQLWQDINGDGLRDPDEAPLPAIPVSLLDSSGVVIQSTTTDDQGLYRFEADPDQTYSVEVGGNLRLSLANAGGDESLDSDFDPATRRSETFTPAIAEQITLDAGLLPEGQ
jgi:WD40 repeat protein